MLAVSYASWLDLPGFSISDWLQGTPLIPRLPSIAIAQYMQCYADELGLSKSIMPHTKVTSIRKTGEVWTVSGVRADGSGFSYTAKHVVLACGKMKQKQLELAMRNPALPVVYDTVGLKSHMMNDSTLGTSGSNARVVVIGDGISSADAVRACLEHEIPVLHVMRRTERQLKSTLFSRLSPAQYSEYHSVYRLMIGKDEHPLYEGVLGSNVTDVDEKSVLTVSTAKGTRYVSLCVFVQQLRQLFFVALTY
ncbi:hypothetical protein OESDEN_11509 [Oesophagostomum dentatum]|uniref:Uncharacterized protein n=1 Tax=Oesophagostomum dentatum TaxID=61180 RepID=A0A0B1SUT4_OESDE|nr:hypothetical protein OESDEN_11509 [Oesophagostomum dentatum]